MCAIGGELVPPRFAALDLAAEIEPMMAAMNHRGPDGQGAWADAEYGVVLGHRRLAIVDLSARGAQPMSSADGRFVVTYNGEIYNHRELRQRLEASGTRFRGNSDTETLVEALAAWGVDQTLQRIEGMFALASWDRSTRRLHVARDRIGEKPLYWSHSGSRFGFASELKGLRELAWISGELNPDAVASVLRWGFVAAPATMRVGVFQLRPGHVLEVSRLGDSLQVHDRTYWSLEETVAASARADSAKRSIDDAAEELETLLARSVAQRMLSDVPIGTFISGGIDSTAIAALAQRALGGQRLQTFTVRMEDARFDESDAASTVANAVGSEHTTVTMTSNDALAFVPQLASMWDEPLGDPSILPSALLCRAARRTLTVGLTGDGGDEVFAGYNRHVLSSAVMRSTRLVPSALRQSVGRGLVRTPLRWSDRLERAVERAAPPQWRVRHLGDKVHKAGALIGSHEEQVWTHLAGVWSEIGAGTVPGPRPAPCALGGIETMLWNDLTMVLPDNMLVKMDRAGMANSLELRLPLLAPEVVAWAWNQPLAHLLHRGIGKRVLRRVVDRLGFGSISQLPKHGFDPPLADWLRGPLRPWAEELLRRPAAVELGFLSAASVSATWDAHCQGRRNHEYRLWALLMLEDWLRVN